MKERGNACERCVKESVILRLYSTAEAVVFDRASLLGSALAEGDAALDGVEFDAGSIDSGEVTKVHTLREAAESGIRKICKDLLATGHRSPPSRRHRRRSRFRSRRRRQ